MIKITPKTIDKVGEKIAQGASKIVSDAVQTAERASVELPRVPAETLGAYAGVKAPAKSKVRNLFRSYDEFIQSQRERILNFRMQDKNGYDKCIPRPLYEAVQKSAQKDNFEFSKVMQEYYSGLKECKTLEEVCKRYPEFRNLTEFSSAQTPRLSERYKIYGCDNSEELVIDLLKQVHALGKPLDDAFVTLPDGSKLTAKIVLGQKQGYIDKDVLNFRKLLEEIEMSVKDFYKLDNLSGVDIRSEVLTQTWTRSGLRRDYGNATRFGKGWSNIRNILQKAKYPESPAYPSERIIDAFLLQQYKIDRVAKGGNPFEKMENITEDITQKIQRFVNARYQGTKLSFEDVALMRSEGFQRFKSQYDLEGMKKSWENIEEHYKNIFFKIFWDEGRVERFTKALNESREIASQNIKISDELLSKAMLELVE